VDAQILQDQLEQRIKFLESSDSAEHLVGDLPARDIVACVLALTLMTAVLLWWAY
jgi:hypothetical protein